MRIEARQARPQAVIRRQRGLRLEPDEMLDHPGCGTLHPAQQQLALEQGAVERALSQDLVCHARLGQSATSVRAVVTTSATSVASCSEPVSGCRMQARSVSRPAKTVPVTKARPRA